MLKPIWWKVPLRTCPFSTGPVESKWMGAILFYYILFNSIAVIHVSGRWMDDNERLCAMEPHLWLRRLPLEQDSEVRITRSGDQHLTHWATGTPPVELDVERYPHLSGTKLFSILLFFWSLREMLEELFLSLWQIYSYSKFSFFLYFRCLKN